MERFLKTTIILGGVFTIGATCGLKATMNETAPTGEPQAYYLARGGPGGGGFGGMGGGMGHGGGMGVPGLDMGHGGVVGVPGLGMGHGGVVGVPGSAVGALMPRGLGSHFPPPALQKPLPGNGNAFGRGFRGNGLHRGEEKHESTVEQQKEGTETLRFPAEIIR